MKKIQAFTLVEIMVGILIFSFVMVAAFQSLTAIWIWKIRLIQSTQMEKQSIYFAERFFEMIKAWGTLDYEEYFNRTVVNSIHTGDLYLSGHYKHDTGYWNYGRWWNITAATYWDGHYYCRSDNASLMGTWGCINSHNTNTFNMNGEYQRYWQYAYHFIDYNSNFDNDWGNPGDEDGDGSIIGDDDDEFLWVWPVAFVSGQNQKELYLISWDRKKRTFFRWNVINDPDSPGICDFSVASAPTGSWCLWNVQYLSLVGKDWWLDHVFNSSDTTEADGIIDTWIVDPDIASNSGTVIWSWNDSIYWVDLFPDTMNVTKFRVFPYPNGDLEYNWKSQNPDLNVAPYVRIQFDLLPSWKVKKQLKGTLKPMKFSTTISLTDIFSQ